MPQRHQFASRSQELLISLENKMAKSLKYFSHYFQEVQTTKDKFKDYISRNEPESEKLIELSDIKVAIQDEPEVDEKQELINRIMEMSRTLDDITNKIADVKKDTLRLTGENEVMDEYLANLMAQSKTFEPANL